MALKSSEGRIKQRNDELHLMKVQLDQKEAELQRLKSRGWLARLLNKEE